MTCRSRKACHWSCRLLLDPQAVIANIDQLAAFNNPVASILVQLRQMVAEASSDDYDTLAAAPDLKQLLADLRLAQTHGLPQLQLKDASKAELLRSLKQISIVRVDQNWTKNKSLRIKPFEGIHSHRAALIGIE